MKKLLLLAAIVWCLSHFRHRVADADPQILARWNQEKRQAETQLTSELLGYQAYLEDPPDACPRSEAGRQAGIRQATWRVRDARERAVAILQRKPGTLTVVEAERLRYYSIGLTDRLNHGLPGCEALP